MSFVPYSHQTAVYEAVLEGKSVILHAPTGSGKTRAAIRPFIHAAHPEAPEYGRLPRKCLYAVPMRVLANQFFDEYRESIASFNRKFKQELRVKIQTGEMANDSALEGDLIFLTIDQLLSSFLLAPYSLSGRKANINAGAVASSYLVFDEFHLYDPDSTLPTTLHMLKMLRGMGIPFVLMTATFSDMMLAELAQELDAVVIPGDDESLRDAIRSIPAQQKIRRYHRADYPLSADSVLRHHRGKSIVICNTVARAQHLYETLRASASPETQIRLLHSRFLQADRQTKEAYLQNVMGKDSDDHDVIVVATQVIEVGVDISSHCLHTELAPANAVVQRAGRCARYVGEEGDVFVYAQTAMPDDVIDLRENTLPYQNDRANGGTQSDQTRQTWEILADYDGQALDYAAEQAFISAVHREADVRIIQRLREDVDYVTDMRHLMDGSSREAVQRFVRVISNTPITIHPNPTVALKQDPYRVPSFGLYRGTLIGAIKRWLATGGEGKIWGLLEHDLERDDEQTFAEFNEERREWQEIWGDDKGNPQKLGKYRLLCVHPELATYSPDLGLLLDRGGDWYADTPLAHDNTSAIARSSYTYKWETYAEHIRLVHEVFKGYWDEVAYAAESLERHEGWQNGTMRQAAEIAVLLHDTGKLSEGWQGWVRRYAEALGTGVTGYDDFYAHTQFDRNDPYCVNAQRKAGKRPWHAVESAVVASRVALQVFGKSHPLVSAIYSAIARHHAPFSDTPQDFVLVDSAPDLIQQTINQLASRPFDLPANLDGLGTSFLQINGLQRSEQLISRIHSNQPISAFWAYILLVRLLRRSDSEGTARGSI